MKDGNHIHDSQNIEGLHNHKKLSGLILIAIVLIIGTYSIAVSSFGIASTALQPPPSVCTNSTFLQSFSGNTTVCNTVPLSGTLTFFFDNQTSLNTVNASKRMLPTPNSTEFTPTYINVPNNVSIQNWTTKQGTPNISFIPSGDFLVHLHASASHNDFAMVYAQIWEVNRTGVFLNMIGQTEHEMLTTTETQFDMIFVNPDTYFLNSSSSRIMVQIFIHVMADSPDVTLYFGGEADSRLSLPSATVDASNFIPYLGATKDANLGTFNLTANNVIANNLANSIPKDYDYLIYLDNTGTINARNGSTGSIDFSGSNITTIFSSVVSAMPNGGMVGFSSGVFPVSSPLVPQSNVHIKGQGIGITILQGTPLLGNAVIERSTNIGGSSITNPIGNFYLEDVEIDGSTMASNVTTHTGGKGIFFQYINNSLFRNVKVHDAPGSCFGNDAEQNVVYENDYAIGCGRSQPVTVGGSGFGIGVGAYTNESTLISNSFAIGNWNQGITFESVFATNISSHMKVINSYVANNRNGIVFFSSNASGSVTYAEAIGNSVENNSAAGVYIYLTSTQITVSDNMIKNNSVGIDAQQSVSNNEIISHNIISNSGTYGLRLRTRNAIVDGNFIFNSSNDGVRIEGNVLNTTNVIFSNNQVFNNGMAGVVGDNDGVRIDGSVAGNTTNNVTISQNKIYDSQSTPTQRYGVIVSSTGNYNVRIKGNEFFGNTAASILDLTTKGNVSIFNNFGYSGYQWGIMSIAPSNPNTFDEYTNTTSGMKCYRINSTTFVNLQNYTSIGC